MLDLIWVSLALLFFVPGPVGFVLGQQGARSWPLPTLVAGLVFVCLIVVVLLANAGTFGDEGGAGVVFWGYLLFGAWATVTAVVGVLIGRAQR